MARQFDQEAALGARPGRCRHRRGREGRSRGSSTLTRHSRSTGVPPGWLGAEGADRVAALAALRDDARSSRRSRLRETGTKSQGLAGLSCPRGA